ncbi:MAG: hypothetical protein ABI869_03890 [Actinomycetota bacterium]
MTKRRVRVMVGEGQTARKGLLRFVLENEGYDVVAEATSTLELAQRLAIHRPDVVVLDEGIDASAVGMMREVLPSAKVILVWPRGVTAIGSDARLEPSEVMTSLGSTVGRVMGAGGVIAPPRPRVAPPDVIVVPEPEPTEAAAPVAVVEVRTEPTVVVPEALAGVVMAPTSLAAPTWTYAAAGASATTSKRRDSRASVAQSALVAAVAVIAAVVAIVLGTTYLSSRTVAIRSVSGNVGTYTLPGTGESTSGETTTAPGTYVGVVHIRANGSIRLRASGDLHVRIDGISHIVALGDVQIHGDGVINNVSSSHVRVRGNGTIRVTLHDGHIRLRVQGSLIAQGKGTVRIGGDGQFLIHHRPL